ATKTATTTAGTNVQVTATSGTNNDNYSTFRINLLDSTSTVGLRLNLSSNDANEVWNVDSVSLFGTLSSGPATSLYFDTNGSTSGIGINGGNATVFDTGTANFTPNSAGTGTPQQFDPN